MAGTVLGLPIVLAFLISFVWTLAWSEPSIALPPSAAVRSVVDAASVSTVKVVAVGCGMTGTGSGFLVGGGLVMTSAHVLGSLPQLFVEDAGGRHRALGVVVDPSMDLAIVRADGLSGRPLRLSSRPLRGGEQGVVLGYPHGGPLQAASAAVRDVRPVFARRHPLGPSFGASVLQLQAHVVEGDSGGPFLGLDGKVLGVVFSRAIALEDVAYAVKAERLAERVHDAEQAQRGTGIVPAAPPPRC